MQLHCLHDCVRYIIWYRLDSPLFPVFLCGGGTIRKMKKWLGHVRVLIMIVYGIGSLAACNQLLKGPTK